MSSLNIYIACHKAFNLPTDEFYVPIQVGRQIANTQLDMLGDNGGDNISEKNKTYCELTALYWIWKNDKTSDYVGLCHYRRYFDLKNTTVEELFGDNTDVVFTNPRYHFASVQNSALKYVCSENWAILHKVIKKIHPEYEDAFIKSMTGTKAYEYNMLICRKDLFDNYCEWLFSILFECEKHIKLSPYSRERRVFGYLSEYLMYTYFLKNRSKIKTLPLVLYDGKNCKVIKPRLLAKVVAKLIDLSHLYKGKFLAYNGAHELGLINDNIVI